MNETTKLHRLDIALLHRGLVRSRAQAKDFIRRGFVEVNGQPARRLSAIVTPDTAIRVSEEAPHYVSRGAEKLLQGLEEFGMTPSGRIALDVGSSTGGFTEILLSKGANHVFAVDVGRAQLHDSLRRRPDVTTLEGTDIRTLCASELRHPIEAITIDVSFISLAKVLPSVFRLAGANCWMIALIKPQFELGPSAVGRGGQLRPAADTTRATEEIQSFVAGQPDWNVNGIVESPILGGAGNREFLIAAQKYS
ncbi:MAG: TlyA family RNA methyltransferase [Hyphomicrobiaceae bacterium]